MKAQLHVVAGSYALPDTVGSAIPFSIPACVRTADAAGGATTGMSSTTNYTSSMFGNDTFHNYPFTFSLSEGTLTGNMHIAQSGTTPAAATLDGSPGDPFGLDGLQYYFSYCTGSECPSGAIQFDSCTHETSTLNVHNVTFTGGDEIHLELRIGESAAGTEPSAFVRAHGSFGGIAFDQRDYWKLVYNPTHHHFERHFAAFFPEPIDGVCGIEIDGLEPWDDFATDVAFAIDCELGRIRALTVTDHSWERP